MRKHIILLLVAASIVLLFLASCRNVTDVATNTAPTENATGTTTVHANHSVLDSSEAEPSKLTFQSIGTYNMRNFDKTFSIYRFDGINAVVYELSPSVFLLAEDAGETGEAYSQILLKNGQFLAISDKYWLFQTEEGKVAIPLTGKNDVPYTNHLLASYSFDDLSAEDQAAFVYQSTQEIASK